MTLDYTDKLVDKQEIYNISPCLNEVKIGVETNNVLHTKIEV